MGSGGLFAVFVLVSLFANCRGQTTICFDNLSGAFDRIVVEEENFCVLSSVTANFVTVNDDAFLTVQGVSDIGQIDSNNGAIIDLKNQTSVGSIVPATSASITITGETTTFVETLTLSDVGDTAAQGQFGTINSLASGVLNVSFSTIRDELRVQGGSGDVNICGSNVMSGTFVSSRVATVTFGSLTGCDGSRFDGAVSVASLSGSVFLQSSVVASELSLTSVTGSVTVSASNLGTTSITDVSGDVFVTTSTANEEATLEDIQGALTLTRISFFGLVAATQSAGGAVGPTAIRESSFMDSALEVRLDVQQRGNVTVASNNFFNGTAVFMGNTGPVTFRGNGNVNVSFTGDDSIQIFENNIGDASLRSCTGGVLIENNSLRSADLDSCSGDILIRRNSFGTLNCTDNDPAPVGQENSVSEASGQCAGF